MMRQQIEIDDVKEQEEVKRILLGATNQLGAVYRDAAAVFGGLDQLRLFTKDDEIIAAANEARSWIRKASDNVLKAMKPLKAQYNLKTNDGAEVPEPREDYL